MVRKFTMIRTGRRLMILYSYVSDEVSYRRLVNNTPALIVNLTFTSLKTSCLTYMVVLVLLCKLGRGFDFAVDFQYQIGGYVYGGWITQL